MVIRERRVNPRRYDSVPSVDGPWPDNCDPEKRGDARHRGACGSSADVPAASSPGGPGERKQQRRLQLHCGLCGAGEPGSDGAAYSAGGGARLVLVGPGQAINSVNDSPFRKSLLVLLVVEAVALSLLALILHFLWSDVPGRSNFTVLVLPLATMIVLGTVSLLGRPGVPVIFLGVPLAFWMGILPLLHLGQFALDDP